jgi:uncharacterized Zn finger protein
VSEQSSNDIDLSCQECGASELNTIPVWKDKSDYENEELPDYVGCEVCGIMRPLKSVTEQKDTDTT